MGGGVPAVVVLKVEEEKLLGVELKTPGEVVVGFLLALHLAMEVFLSCEGGPGDLFELRIVDFAGKLEVVLELRHSLVTLPELILLPNHTPEVPCPLLRQQN